MDSCFGNNVGVETVAEVNWVDVVTERSPARLAGHVLDKSELKEYCLPLEVTVHDGEEDLQEEIDGIY